MRIELAVSPCTVGPGKLPILEATIVNRSDEELVAGSNTDGIEGAVHLAAIGMVYGGSIGHGPLRTLPGTVRVPPHEERTVTVVWGAHPDFAARWIPGVHELVLSYGRSRVATWTEAAAWELRDDGSAATLDGVLTQLRVSSIASTLSVHNRELRPVTLPATAELDWWLGAGEWSTTTIELPPHPPIRYLETAVLPIAFEPPAGTSPPRVRVRLGRSDSGWESAPIAPSSRRLPRVGSRPLRRQ